MDYRQLGASDLRVSEICLGTMTWGEQNSEKDAHQQLDLAFDRGVNFLDTAEMYAVPTRPETQGLTETYVGSWLKDKPREKVVIAGKVTAPSPNPWIPPRREPPQPPSVPRLDKTSIRAAVQGSLRRLGVDYIDLVELHWPERYVGTLFGAHKYERVKEQIDVVSFAEQVEGLADLVREGKVRAWGLSNETSFGVCSFAEAAKRLGAPPPVSIQNDFSLLDRTFEPELAEACTPRHHNLGLLVYGALAGGTLTGKYRGGEPPKARHTLWPNFQPRYHTSVSRWAAGEYATIAERHGLTPAALALAWSYGREYVTSTIVGATTIAQLRECLDALNTKLSDEVMGDIEQQHLRLPNPNKAGAAISPGFVKDVRKGV